MILNYLESLDFLDPSLSLSLCVILNLPYHEINNISQTLTSLNTSSRSSLLNTDTYIRSFIHSSVYSKTEHKQNREPTPCLIPGHTTPPILFICTTEPDTDLTPHGNPPTLLCGLPNRLCKN